MRQPFLCLLFMIMITSLYSQHELTGRVVDESQQPLPGVTAILMSTSDSSMTGFAISNSNGDFRIEDVINGDYFLQLSFVSYKSLTIPIKTDWTTRVISLGKYDMEVQTEVLAEITIEAERIPLGVNGDTITYNTSAFATRQGATVEDLLKRLPGVEVARDGSIKAQGENVKNVLVDGKEFFGKDPKIATQNLDAEAVEKVEVFDKASEMAEFTGIDDGQDEKTINLQLKEDFKTGGFGRAAIAGGTKERYDGKLNYNRFNTKMQASVILSANNINKQAFSFNEYISMMGGINNAIANNNGIFNFGGNQQVEGLSDDLSSGVNFNYDFSNKLSLKSHYFYIRKDKNLLTNSSSTLFNNNIDYISSADNMRTTIGQNHRFNSTLLFKHNPLFQVQLKNSFTGVISDDNSIGNTQYLSEISSSATNSIYNNISDQFGYQGDLQIRKKYKTKGRNWITNIKMNNANVSQEDDVINEFNLNGIDTYQNQLQQYSSNEQDLTLDSRFAEPIAKKQYLSLSYIYNQNIETPEKLFFDRDLSTLLENEDLSAAFRKDINRHNIKSSYRYNGRKLKSTVALAHQWSDIQSEVINTDQIVHNNAQHFLPSAKVSYDFTNFKRLSIEYNTSVNLPSLSQLTPIPNNTNPNLLIKGNANLIPEYQHQYRMHFSVFDNFSMKNFFLFGSIMSIKNKIINAISIDNNFLRTVTPINTDQYTRVNITTSYNAPIRPLKIKYSIRADVSTNSYETTLNDALSGVKENTLKLNLSIENRKKKVVDLIGGIKYNISHRAYDLNSDFDQTYSNYALYLDGVISTDNGWTISSTFDWNTYSDASFAEQQTYSLWNASIRKSFNDGKITLNANVYDILGQNIGLKRNGGLNSLNEIHFNTLTRYATIGISYKIGKHKAPDTSILFD